MTLGGVQVLFRSGGGIDGSWDFYAGVVEKIILVSLQEIRDVQVISSQEPEI